MRGTILPGWSSEVAEEVGFHEGEVDGFVLRFGGEISRVSKSMVRLVRV